MLLITNTTPEAWYSNFLGMVFSREDFRFYGYVTPEDDSRSFFDGSCGINSEDCLSSTMLPYVIVEDAPASREGRLDFSQDCFQTPYEEGLEDGYEDWQNGYTTCFGDRDDDYARGYRAGNNPKFNAPPLPTGFAVACKGGVGWYDGNHPNCCGNCKA